MLRTTATRRHSGRRLGRYRQTRTRYDQAEPGPAAYEWLLTDVLEHCNTGMDHPLNDHNSGRVHRKHIHSDSNGVSGAIGWTSRNVSRLSLRYRSGQSTHCSTRITHSLITSAQNPSHSALFTTDRREHERDISFITPTSRLSMSRGCAPANSTYPRLCQRSGSESSEAKTQCTYPWPLVSGGLQDPVYR